MKENAKYLLGCGLLILVIGFLLCHAFSLQAALFFSGYDADQVTYIEYRSLDASDKEFSVILTTKGNGRELALVETRKNWLGFWTIHRQYVTNTEIGLDDIYTTWVSPSRVRRFSATDDPIFERAVHYAYCGRNAIKFIEFSPGQIPENVAVNIRQAGKYYLIHVITYAESASIDFNVISVLQENGCIAE